MKLKLLKLLIIPLLLTIGYLTLVSYPYFFSKINRYDSLGPLSLVEEKSVNLQKTLSKERRTDQFDNHLLKGERISGKIKASENNFGILLFRFAKLSVKVSDVVVFRIKKEEEKDKWYYEHIYKADQFQDNQYFTFGFPPIINSKNNNYIFEVESLSGTYKNGVGVSLDEPQAAFVYKYTLSDLKNYKTLSTFIFKKFVYVVGNVNFLQNWQLLAAFVLPLLLIFFMQKKKITVSGILRFLPNLKNEHRKILKVIINKIKSNYLSLEKKIVNFSKKVTNWFTSTKFYLQFLNTNTKKRLMISLLIFLLALTYRFSASLVDQEGVTLFYAGLGGQGDYDQFIRAATCAVTNFCSAILGQNFLFEASILGMFYKIFGFTGGLKAYLYLMLILSSIVVTLPYLLLSRKSWISLGGIIGGVYLATSDFLTQMALNFPPDNGSLFTFSMFYIVYFLTLQKGTIRWLLFFGLMGLIDGLNKALFLINDLSVFFLFIPVFFYEKAKQKSKSLLRKENRKILFLSLLPLLVFLVIYIGWEYFVYIKFSAYYFLRGLIGTGGENYVYYTSANDASLAGNIMFKLFYLGVSAIVMIKRLIEYTDLQIILLAPIFLSMFILTFVKTPFDILRKFSGQELRARKFPIKKFILVFSFSVALIALLTLIKNNYYGIHKIFEGEYILGTWTDQIYIRIFLFTQLIILFILNFKYSALKLSLPIIPYVIILIILAKNSPFARLHTHVVAWSIILLAYIIDFLILNINKYSIARIRIILGPVLLILFIFVYMFPKMVTMITQLNSGFAASQSEIRYLKWVNSELPRNAVILAGGKSDLVTVGENIQRPIVYNALYSAAILIRQDEIPGVKSSDFGITGVQFLKGRIRIPSVGATDFSIVSELKNKDNFKRNKYIILEDDISIWRSRVTGVGDNVFSTSSATLLHADDYSIKVYKLNPTLEKAIYELNTRDTSVN